MRAWFAVRHGIGAPMVYQCANGSVRLLCAYGAVRRLIDYQGGLWAKHKAPFLTFFKVWLPTYCQAYKSAKNVVLIDTKGFSNGETANIASIQKEKST